MKSIQKIYFLIMIVVVAWNSSCKQPNSNSIPTKGQLSLDLIQLDKDFSDSCKLLGKSEAFMHFLDSNAILLRPDYYPIEGYVTTDYLIEQHDEDFDFKLFPKQADVSESGDLGFTYGVYEIRPKSYDTAIYGTYTNIWKKQPDGKWKLSLNAENTGVGE